MPVFFFHMVPLYVDRLLEEHLMSHKDQAPDDEALMPPNEAAKFLSRPENWLAKRRVTGDGPKYVKLGIRVFYRRCDLKDWISKHVISNTSQKTEAAHGGC